MMKLQYGVFLHASIFYLQLVASVRLSSSNVVVERLKDVPNGWVQQQRADPHEILGFRIALAQQHANLVEQHVLAISDPDHENYGKHLGHKELKSMLRPHHKASAAILQWLKSAGVWQEKLHDDGDWVNFYLPVKETEVLLDTTFYHFHNSITNAKTIRTLQYSVPERLRSYIHMIQPTTRFTQIPLQKHRAIRSRRARKRNIAPTNLLDAGIALTTCGQIITPECIRQLYGMDDMQNDSSPGSIGIAGFLGVHATHDDFEDFLTWFAPKAKDAKFSTVEINSGQPPSNDNNTIEGNTDLQYAFSLAYPSSATFYSTAGQSTLVPDLDAPDSFRHANEPWLDLLQYLLKLPSDQLPSTLSISYGEDEQEVPETYANATCNLFAQLGARGVSVLAASGDIGPGVGCQTNDATNRTRFLVGFPASCPFVTAVGATAGAAPEQAASFSSGGFSDHFAQPAYQQDVISRFLKCLGDEWKGLYNPNGRAVPDVAAQGVDYLVIDQGRPVRVTGTSTATPTFAGIVAHINALRAAKNMTALGFLNPWIYKRGFQGLNDITVGRSQGCTGKDTISGLPAPRVPDAGWNAVPGWDAVTGLGTPNWPKLSELATAS